VLESQGVGLFLSLETFKPFTGAFTMELIYRGQSYEASSPIVEATLTDETATFLGRPFARKQFTIAQRQQPAELTYRGVHYSR
jgi:hypothetical protein